MEFENTMTVNDRIFIRGPLITQSGYGVHARQIARWAFGKEANGCRVDTHALPWGNTPWILDPDFDNGMIGQILQNAVQKPDFDTNVVLQLQLPNEWMVFTGPRAHVGLTAAVETTKCNPEWKTYIDAMDLVVVPSTFARQNLLTAYQPGESPQTPIEIIPESFIDEIFDAKPLALDLPCDFNFLVFGQLTGNSLDTDRKNIFNTIKWFCEAFEGDKNTGMVIKTNMGRQTPIDARVTANLLTQAVSKFRKGQYPRVHLLHGDMTNEEIAGLYVHPKIKAFVSLSFGEGFNIPALEAAASGLPILATAWSGHMDFLSLGRFGKIDYTIKPIPEEKIDGKIFVSGACWAHPSEQDFKKKAKKLRESYSIPLTWAKDLQKIIRERYCFSVVSKRYDEVLGKFLTQA
jgi:glycosyltransferase involved in cell wall biosynthesis